MYSERFDDALVYAHSLHREQTRKGTAIPYVSHLLAVASLVAEHGGDEEQAIGALLHDAAEDQGGEATLEAIGARFGERVRAIVAACSDTFEQPKPPWRARKEAYLAHCEAAAPDVLLVSAADKLHNARALVRDLRRDGAGTFGRFKGGRDGTLWYYRSLAELFGRRMPGELAEELARVVATLERLAEAAGS